MPGMNFQTRFNDFLISISQIPEFFHENQKSVREFVTVQPEFCVERRTHGRDFFTGRRQRERLSRFSVHFFRLGVSKQNGISFLRRRDALKRHPCRLRTTVACDTLSHSA